MSIKIFTTRPEGDNNVVFEIMMLSISRYCRGKSKTDIEWFYYSSLVQVKRLFPLLAILRATTFLFFSFFCKHYWLHFKYKGVNVGRYAMSTSFRDVDSNTSNVKYYSSVFINALKGVTLIYRIEKCNQDFDAFFIEHGVYLNGIFIEYASQKNKLIFTYGYPYGMICKSTSKKISYEDLFRLPFNNSFIKNTYFDEGDLINDIPYLSKISETDNKIDCKDVDMVIYSHSFTDAQIIFGPRDAYINMYDWLNDVCKILSKSSIKVLIKGHPNFYREESSEIVKMDRELFKTFVKKYKNNSNLHFMNKAVSNEHLLNSIGKNTVLVSHHGNALIEGSVKGFKCISSSNSIWKDFFHFNEFYTKKGMREMLFTHHSDLAPPPQKSEIFNYLHVLKRTRFSYYSNEAWVSIIANNINTSLCKFIQTPELLKSQDSKTINKIIKEISDSIYHIDS